MPIHSRKLRTSSSPLASSHLDVRIVDLVAEQVLTHRFENQGERPLEVVYSFPLPLDAAFMGLTATLAGQTHHAEIHARAQAEQRYDDAIADGDAAVLLTTPEPGLLCVSLGNLLPGQQGEIALRFATTLRVSRGEARYSLPLVHRPRYGHWRLDALETPHADFAVEHPLTAHIEVTGLLARATTRCNSHGTRFRQTAGSTQMDIDAAMLDRDLVLDFALDTALPPTVRLVRDGEHNLALANLILPLRDSNPLPLDLCLLLDGSGSMNGDAIVQSRRALAATVDALTDSDRLQVIRFGSDHAAWFRRPLKMTPIVRRTALELVDTVAADLGGTEMGTALDAAIAQFGKADDKRSRAVILITDGAVQPADIEPARQTAQKHGIRVFVIAVGSAAGTEVLTPLADSTGAMLERAIPGEPIDVCAQRQLHRAREQSALELEPHWPEGALSLAGNPAYPGDAITVAALLPASATGELRLAIPALSFATTLALPEATEAAPLRALLGQRRHDAANSSERAALALHYGLLTGDTAAVLVHEYTDEERPQTLPQVAQVASMLPAGMLDHGPCLSMRAAPASIFSRHAKAFVSDNGPTDYLDMPAFLRRTDVGKSVPPVMPALPREQLHALYSLLLRQLADTRLDLDQAIAELPDDQGLLQPWLDWLTHETGCPVEAPDLLLALQLTLDEPPLDDTQEAHLARILQGRSARDVDALGNAIGQTLC